VTCLLSYFSPTYVLRWYSTKHILKQTVQTWPVPQEVSLRFHSAKALVQSKRLLLWQSGMKANVLRELLSAGSRLSVLRRSQLMLSYNIWCYYCALNWGWSNEFHPDESQQLDRLDLCFCCREFLSVTKKTKLEIKWRFVNFSFFFRPTQPYDRQYKFLLVP
jgi:hypothetical protein